MDIKTLQKNETTEQGMLMVRSIVDKIDKNNNPYIIIEATDGKEILSIRIFGFSSEDCGFSEGSVIDIKVSSSKYNGAMTYTGKLTKVLDESEYNISDYIISAPIKSETMYSELVEIMNSFKNSDLKTLVSSIYAEHKEKLLIWSAAKTIHHNFRGGLLYHTYRMVKTAEKITDIYNSCDKEMVIAGCMLHDIGKIYELSTDNFGKSDYTIDGNLFGHLFIGAEIVKNKAKELGINNEITRCLIHIIVSHHENLEWGAITKPSTLEAFLVSQIDYIDANYIRIEDACSKTDKGSLFDSERINGTYIYNPKLYQN